MDDRKIAIFRLVSQPDIRGALPFLMSIIFLVFIHVASLAKSELPDALGLPMSLEKNRQTFPPK
jgi:hypothetical protein